jgi:hypothetical protein
MTSSFGIEMTQNVAMGYEETLCVECKNSKDDITKHDNWKVVQIMNCALALDGANQATAHPDKVNDYVNTGTKLEVASSYSDFFTNPYGSVDICGAITSCSIKVQGCGSAYSGSNLIINSSTGKITAKQNVDAGFVETVCI